MFILIECKICYEIIIKIDGKVVNLVDCVLIVLKEVVGNDFEVFFKMIILDNGVEFVGLIIFFKDIMEVYFIYFYFLWEWGINENYNGMICCFILKGICMEDVVLIIICCV